MAETLPSLVSAFWRFFSQPYFSDGCTLSMLNANICIPWKPLGRIIGSTELERAGPPGPHASGEFSRTPSLCTLDLLKPLRDHNHPAYFPYFKPWWRTRCLNCGRPLRIYTSRSWAGPSRNERTCCADCARLARNKRNAERRRVKRQPIACIACGRFFVPKRTDTMTCSNKCRQAMHRDRLCSAQRQLSVTRKNKTHLKNYPKLDPFG
jgi:hypothetical protein